MNDRKVRKYVRDRYAEIARGRGACCGVGPSRGPGASCCGDGPAGETNEGTGYSVEERSAVPEGADLGLGCGNPVAHASLKEGETVLDLGSGAGFDCFLAARRVGPSGKVIGVDMTPEMVEKARGNAARGGFRNVEFRLGEIEHLPAPDGSVDVVISNCVVNLSTAKERVFAEAWRVLKNGGRLMISDLVLSGTLPEEIAGSLAAYAGCVAGAVAKEEYLRFPASAGFRDVRVVEEKRFPAPRPVAEAVRSVAIFARKETAA